ncbi:hypothetical protein BN940_00166 [Castellaniella defragrans 65Phen]|uniref:Uncharacterized protein n=1 Tax=Castellaniella defragrans (strain DSM 12143 / CCUG 39792 / 65Phen) TaxID=1437824 RepID=W8WSL6_CASD6|nr:hypothetical protein BN940_00166 [Castellaniella defragrans 65Phen]
MTADVARAAGEKDVHARGESMRGMWNGTSGAAAPSGEATRGRRTARGGRRPG